MSNLWRIRNVKTQEIVFSDRPFMDCETVARNYIERETGSHDIHSENMFMDGDRHQALYLWSASPSGNLILAVESVR